MCVPICLNISICELAFLNSYVPDKAGEDVTVIHTFVRASVCVRFLHIMLHVHGGDGVLESVGASGWEC